MPRALAVAVVVVATIATSGCAWRSDVKRLRADVRQMAHSVNLMAAQPAAPTVASVDALSAKVTSLGAQVAAIDARLQETTAQLGRLEARVSGAERAVQEVAGRIDGLAATVTKLEASVARPAPPVAVAPRAPKAMARPEQAYAAALAMFRRREHGQAVLDFLDFLGRHPKHALAPSAQFWIAEAYYVQRDYRQALVEYEKVLAYGGGHSKMADALLRAGMASKQLRDAERAGQFWRRVVEEYPNSDAAHKARGFLSGIGGSPPAR